MNVYELSFGTVCGLCAGVFLKKGAKALAFIFGGIFVMLQVSFEGVFFVARIQQSSQLVSPTCTQYFGSTSLIKVDWQKAGSRFERLFYSAPTEPGGARRPPTLYSLYSWFVDFLTANFQQRASFLAGFALGLRVG